MASRLRRRARQRIKIAAIAFIATVGIAFAGVVIAAAMGDRTPPPVSDKVAAYLSNPPTIATSPKPAPLAPAVALLGDKARPWTLQVVGDSTGAGPARWVYVLAPRLSSKYDRPVVIHDWSITSNNYAAETTVGAGSGQPIVIWNGSASGKGTQYSLDNWASMVTQQPDLFVLNHGLNMPDAQSARVGAQNIVDKAIQQWAKPPAIALTIQSPRIDKDAATEVAITNTLRQAWTGSPVTLIDVNQAFTAAGDPVPLLISDGLHPSTKGASIWADTVQKALGL